MTENLTELVMTRVFDAPRELVYRAFTDPDQLSEWFGPVGYSVPRESVDIDLRVGGHQRFEMVPDDPASPPAGKVDGVFDEVIENELLVGHEDLTEQMAALFGAPRLTLRLEFHDEDGKTRLVLRQGPYSQEMSGNAREGWGSSFGKLDDLLAKAA
jgi:uncharacterized protein YndB with AHSA1/START domain